MSSLLGPECVLDDGDRVAGDGDDVEATGEPAELAVAHEEGRGGAGEAALLLRGDALEGIAGAPAGADLDEAEEIPAARDEVELAAGGTEVPREDDEAEAFELDRGAGLGRRPDVVGGARQDQALGAAFASALPCESAAFSRMRAALPWRPRR
jgi:hypothetical protein